MIFKCYCGGKEQKMTTENWEGRKGRDRKVEV